MRKLFVCVLCVMAFSVGSLFAQEAEEAKPAVRRWIAGAFIFDGGDLTGASGDNWGAKYAGGEDIFGGHSMEFQFGYFQNFEKAQWLTMGLQYDATSANTFARDEDNNWTGLSTIWQPAATTRLLISANGSVFGLDGLSISAIFASSFLFSPTIMYRWKSGIVLAATSDIYMLPYDTRSTTQKSTTIDVLITEDNYADYGYSDNSFVGLTKTVANDAYIPLSEADKLNVVLVAVELAYSRKVFWDLIWAVGFSFRFYGPSTGGYESWIDGSELRLDNTLVGAISENFTYALNVRFDIEDWINPAYPNEVDIDLKLRFGLYYRYDFTK